MIISASRRTDLPAFYWEWFLQRVREGFVVVVNPLYKHQVSLISLDPRDVEAIVFWTKNPGPCLDRLPELEEAGFRGRLFFQVTINPYGETILEENLPSLDDRLRALERLAGLVGRKHIFTRYDPLLFSRGSITIDSEYHREWFRTILAQVAPHCSRVITSVVDSYRKSQINFHRLREEQGLEVLVPDQVTLGELAGWMVGEARQYGLDVLSCAEGGEIRTVLEKAGILPGSCIDLKYIEEHLPEPTSLIGKTKDPAQRPECGCMKSRDIGAYHTCLARCKYCYATDFRIAPRPVDPNQDLSLDGMTRNEELNHKIESFQHELEEKWEK